MRWALAQVIRRDVELSNVEVGSRDHQVVDFSEEVLVTLIMLFHHTIKSAKIFQN